MSYPEKLDAIEAKLLEMRWTIALAGWALEWIPQWREDLRLEAEEWDPSKVDRADDARLRIDSLARALGIQKERG